MGPIGRAPEGGRNWEAFGADPYLQGVASYESVLGIQEEGVIATAKHYLLNEQGHFRQYAEWVGLYTNLSAPYSANVDERALREIYAWPFADAIRAGAPPLCALIIKPIMRRHAKTVIFSMCSMPGDGSAASANSNTIVVVESVGVVDLEAWIEHVNVAAVLFSLVAGQDLGIGIADIFPSGKLPFTIAKKTSDYPATVIYDVIEPVPQINFSESIFVDYRHFDKYHIEPRYEFGFGLSYTTFHISGLSLTPPEPPSYNPPLYLNGSVPSPSSAIYPGNIPRYSHYIYTYIEKDIPESITYHPDDYPYPEGYSDIQPSKPSPAGGASGGNPALWDVLVQIHASITNNGTAGDSEVLQLYVSYPAVDGVDFPVRALRGFEKLSASPGETSTANFDPMRRDLSYYAVASHNWLLPRGTYAVYIGTSSRNLAEAGTFSF
ncbi:glycosyl hydrolase family 3 N terminal domain-containing protein [Lipomyces doorenjongii]|uniref:glycosyl hydrolase family 3 N terminal domain-containing protein n=1 Tax=Lipomyces doorenjongii TaxID=383834 RepID=UPI0034CF6BA1